MFFQVIVVTAVLAFVAVTTLVGAPVLRKVMVRAAKRKYAVTLSEALKQAEFYGKMGYLFRAGDYDDILSMRDVLMVRRVYLDTVQRMGEVEYSSSV